MNNTKKSNLNNLSKISSFKKDVATYFKGIKSEWGKITWPERKQAFYETIVIICVVIFFTILVFSMDRIFCFVLHPNDICKSCMHPGHPEECK